MKKKIGVGIALAVNLIPAFALAAVNISNFNTGVASLPLGTADLLTTVINAINWVLGFLILIAVIIVLYGGFTWMTAGGNDEKVGKARNTIVAGIIGLIIVLAAYAIASFVVSQFGKISGIS